MKPFHLIFLFIIFSTKICALENTCPYGCDKDPNIYWDKQVALQEFLSESYPEGKYPFHHFCERDDSYCSYADIEEWYEIKWSGFLNWRALQNPEYFFNQLYVSRYVQFKPNKTGENISHFGTKDFQLRNLAGFLTVLSQLQSDVDTYINSEKAHFNHAVRRYEATLKYFEGVRQSGRTYCCSEGGWGSFPESVEQKIKESACLLKKFRNQSEELQAHANHLQNKLNEARNTILRLHEEQYQNCLTNHQWTGAYYNRGLLNFYRGQISEAFDDICQFMNSLKESEKELLSSETYLNEGIIQAEVNLYNDAISSLSKAITKDPENKEAYFQRAAAYFETGEFDLALQDYLTSGMHSTLEEPTLPFSKAYATGLIAGIKKGVAEEFGDGLPVWSPMLNIGLWALTSAPSPHAKFISGVLTCVAATAVYAAADQISSELKNLVTNWNQLTQKERGEISGYIIRKYGIDIFVAAGSAKLMKAYQDLKRANNILTFEMMLLEETQVASLKNRYKAIEKTKKDKEYIKKYFGKDSYPEQEIRDNLKKMGYQIPAKPAGIPDNLSSMLRVPEFVIMIHRILSINIFV